MKLLISGATGYVGSHLLKKMDINKYQVAVLVRKDHKNISEGITVIDLEEGNWKEKVRNFDADTVLHLASHLTSSDDEKSINELIDANILFGTHLLDAVKGSGIKSFINTGTFAEYHIHNGKRTPAYLYAATKTAFCSILDYYQAIIGFKLFNVIPYTIYGNRHSALKLIDHIYNSFASPEAVLMSPGEQVLDFIHINDVVDFYITLLSRLDQLNNNYTEIHLGTGKGVKPRDVAALMEKIKGKKANIHWGGLPYRQMDTMFSIAPQNLSATQIGWQPSIDIEQGVLMYLKEKENEI